MTDYDIIRTACVKANPDAYEFGIPRLFRLADVLLALQDNEALGDYTNTDGYLTFLDYTDELPKTAWSWNLRNDDLSQQSPETLKFLAELLAPKE